ncbi:serine/threonine-protein kinase EDR1-like [Iris pallida]|uniref:non-specific serine/threonine protein kinase n=1 Tax=Iris pallida TaxID=29817 RepID=A0AAX6EGE5_IRIPA|nr:serine/threonine-protein kinase EDR1-like [Iris pallida]
MPRMKHFLKKLHIGGGGADQRMTVPPPPPESPSGDGSDAAEPIGEGSGPLAPAAPSSATSAAGDDDAGFSFFEEEYQVQLAMAISASDPDGLADPDSVQINAAKRMSLGCSASIGVGGGGGGGGGGSPMGYLSFRYWNYNVVNYDEKLTDGFYDVYGIVSNCSLQGEMPSLVSLQAMSVSDNVDYGVVTVNRTIDQALQKLETRAVSISSECRTTQLGPVASGLVQKIANLVVDSMGGPVSDADGILRRWTIKSHELRTSLNTVVLPLGLLEVGLSRHRALLFKVLADRVNLPCALVKGSYYTGTDEGAVNLIKIDDGSEYIIDLMGAPGSLIPAEIPSIHLQNSGLNLLNSATVEQTVKDLCLALDNVSSQFEKQNMILEGSSYDRIDAGLKTNLNSRVSPLLEIGSAKTTEQNQTEKFEHEFGKLLPPLGRPQVDVEGISEATSSAQQMKLNDVSKYVVSAAKDPEFAQKLHAVLLESGASPPTDLFSDLNPSLELEEQKGSGNENIFSDGSIREKEAQMHNNLSMFFNSSLVTVREEKCSSSTNDKNTQQNFSEGACKESKLAYTNRSPVGMCNPSPFATSEGFTSLETPVTEIALANSRFDGTCLVRKASVSSSTSQGKLILETFSKQPQYVNAPLPLGAQCSQADVGSIVTTANANINVFLKDDRGSADDSKLKHIARDDNNLQITSVAVEEQNNPLAEVAEWEIPWENLQIGERIGLGSCGEVYRADWNGTEVAVKKFLDQDLSGDALEQFRCEVKIMLRLRHPNVVLFMGAVTRPPNLSILTEYLPRGSLYRLLHRPKVQLEEKRRLRMALDVAKGMNYLHSSHPPIVHRDLKSPNLLVDRNWVVKVCDFGLSRLKHHTFLSSKSTAGTPEWMAPEVLRNEPSDEKSDVYSFGVILWELATLRMPWSGMNPMQVVGAVGFQNRRLDIPKEIDPVAAQIISDCWQSDPSQRPSFAQLMSPLKQLQRFVVAAR